MSDRDPRDSNNSKNTNEPNAQDDVDPRQRARQRAKEHTIAGSALGAASLGSLALFGTFACPLCVVAAPALVCSGLWNAHKARCKDGTTPKVGADGVPDRICFDSES